MKGVLAPALATLSATGCIVADAPEYGSPQRSPIYMFLPVPTTPAALKQLSSNDTSSTAFGATLKSEDANEQIVVNFIVDYTQKNQRFLDSQVLQPYTFERDRPVAYHVTVARDFPQSANTCHSITLLATHYTSWDQGTKQFTGPQEDLSTMTWFVAIDDDGSTLLSKCPSASNEPP